MTTIPSYSETDVQTYVGLSDDRSWTVVHTEHRWAIHTAASASDRETVPDDGRRPTDRKNLGYETVENNRHRR